MTNDTPEAGWYSDPLDENLDRYWDGSNWTQDTRAAVPRDTEAVPAATAGPAGPVDDAPEPAGRRSRVPLVISAAVVAIALVAGGFLLLAGDDEAPGRLYVQDRPDRSGSVHVVRPGDALDTTNEILREAAWINVLQPSSLSTNSTLDSGETFLEYAEEGSTTSEFGLVTDGRFVELIRLREESVDVAVADDGQTHVISTWSYADSGGSCFVGSDLEHLVEIRTDGGCIASSNGSVFLATEWDDGIIRYEVVDRNDDEILRGESEDNPVLSPDGTLLVTVGGGARQELEMWDLRSGEQLPADTRADDITISGIVGDRVVVHAWDESSGRSDVLLIARDGTETELTRTSARYSQVVRSAGIVAVSEPGETTIFGLTTGQELGSIRADWVQFATADDGRWMAFAVSDGRVDVHWADGEQAPTEIGSHRLDSPQPSWAYFGVGSTGAYSVESWSDRGTEGVVARVSGATEAAVLAEDLSLFPAWISPDAGAILALNYDGGAELTLLRAGERTEVLDDEDSIYGVRVRDGVAYYTARRDDDYEVRSVAITPDARPITVFEDAALVTIDGAETNGTTVWLQGD